MLTNKHDPTDTIETFQPVTVGIHVQEMKGFRMELILSLLASHAFEEGADANGEEGKTSQKRTSNETEEGAKRRKKDKSKKN